VRLGEATAKAFGAVSPPDQIPYNRGSLVVCDMAQVVQFIAVIVCVPAMM